MRKCSSYRASRVQKLREADDDAREQEQPFAEIIGFSRIAHSVRVMMKHVHCQPNQKTITGSLGVGLDSLGVGS